MPHTTPTQAAAVLTESEHFRYRADHPYGPCIISKSSGRWHSVDMVREMASLLPTPALLGASAGEPKPPRRERFYREQFENIIKAAQEAGSDGKAVRHMTMLARNALKAKAPEEATTPVSVGEPISDEQIESLLSDATCEWREDVFVAQASDLWALLRSVADAERPAATRASSSAQAVEPDYECYSDSDGDYWRDCPDDVEFVDGLKVGDTYKLSCGFNSHRRTFRVTKAPDSTSDDYEVELLPAQIAQAKGGAA